MKIVLDSTVLIENFHLRGPKFRLLEWFVNNGHGRLVVPQIVVAEVTNKYRQTLDERFISFESELRKLQKLVDRGLDMPIATTDVDKAASNYAEFLERSLKALDAETPDYQDIPHLDIVARDLERRRPFRGVGKNQRQSTGYRDTLIWEIVLRKIVAQDELVVFVTNNIYDFWQKGTRDLHPDLQRDLAEAGFRTDMVKLCRDLNSFNRGYVKPLMPPMEEAKILLERGVYYEFSVGHWIDDNVDEIISHFETRACNPLDFFPVDIGAFTISWIEDITDLSVEDVYQMTEEAVVIDVSFLAMVSLYFYVYGFNYEEITENSGLDVSVDEFNGHGAWLEGYIKLGIQMSLTFNIQDKKVEEFEASFREIYGWCQFCGEPYLSDGAETCSNCGR